MSVSVPSIAKLGNLVESLSKEDKELFQRLFHLNIANGSLSPPETMRSWITQQFGSEEAVTQQKIIKVTNLVTFEGALFNPLRSSRPIAIEERLRIEAQIIDALKKEDFLRYPEKNTPADVFGRIEGKYCVSASNVAKYDGLHGLIIFKDYNPLHFTRHRVIDYLETGWRWAEAAREVFPDAKYYLFVWNSLRRAGASLLHGHAQVTLATKMHYAKIEGLRRAIFRYRQEYGSDYFADLYQVHRALGCAIEKEGVKILAYLTPVKEKEVVFWGEKFDLAFKEMVYEVLACLRDKMHVTAFNFVLIPPPLAKTEEEWEGFPVLARVVDRGDPKMTSCDIGTMELYAANVISSDPLEVARLLREGIEGGK